MCVDEAGELASDLLPRNSGLIVSIYSLNQLPRAFRPGVRTGKADLRKRVQLRWLFSYCYILLLLELLRLVVVFYFYI